MGQKLDYAMWLLYGVIMLGWFLWLGIFVHAFVNNSGT